MVISDTAVGIGKVPESQLDVRGSLNVTGAFNGNSSIRFFRFRYTLTTSTATQYLKRTGASTNGETLGGYFTSDYDDTRIISISSVVYNSNGDVVQQQGQDASWLASVYSIPLHSGSANAGLVIYNKGASVVSSAGANRHMEILVITY
jgi:hypothetical protein